MVALMLLVGLIRGGCHGARFSTDKSRSSASFDIVLIFACPSYARMYIACERTIIGHDTKRRIERSKTRVKAGSVIYKITNQRPGAIEIRDVFLRFKYQLGEKVAASSFVREWKANREKQNVSCPFCSIVIRAIFRTTSWLLLSKKLLSFSTEDSSMNDSTSSFQQWLKLAISKSIFFFFFFCSRQTLFCAIYQRFIYQASLQNKMIYRSNCVIGI